MNISTIRTDPGLELKDVSLERVEIVSVEDPSGLDDAEAGFR